MNIRYKWYFKHNKFSAIEINFSLYVIKPKVRTQDDYSSDLIQDVYK